MMKQQLREIMKQPGQKTESNHQHGFQFQSNGVGVYNCFSISGQMYVCNIKTRICTCEDNKSRKRVCKHLKILGCKRGKYKKGIM